MDKEEIEKSLTDLHKSYLEGNKYDEGDPIYYRITYRLEEMFGLTRDKAGYLHEQYHKENPRHVSEGFCDNCNTIVSIIPIIYGIGENEMEEIKGAEEHGRLIIGDMKNVGQGRGVAMFGCKTCKAALPRYGML